MPSLARICRRASLALLTTALAASGARAQDTLGVGDHVRLRLVPAPEDPYPRTRWEGAFVRVDADSVVLRDRRRLRAFALRDVRRAEVRTQVRSSGAGALRYGVRSALVGAGIGLAVASLVPNGELCDTSPGGSCYDRNTAPTGATMLFFAGTTGAIGALYGAQAGRWGWSRVTLAPR